MTRSDEYVAVTLNVWEPWVRGAAEGIRQYARQTDWRLDLVLPEGLPRSRPRGLMGIVGTLYTGPTPDWVADVPAVSIYPAGPIPPERVVFTNPILGGEMVAHHLLERELHHLRVVLGPDEAQARLDRVTAFEQVAHKAGCRVERYALPLSRDRLLPDHERARMVTWLKRQPRPFGVLAIDDNYGAIVIQACMQAGLHVPEDVAVVGSNNDVSTCSFCQPTMSSLALDQLRMGYEAAAMLDRILQGERPDGPKYIRPRGIVTRESTNVQHAHDPAVAVALRYIRDHITEPLSPADVVAASPASARTLQRRFLKERGHTIRVELRQARARQVEQLLIASDAPLADIAAEAGYTHLSQMCREFKATTDMTPTAFRQRWINTYKT